MTIQLPFGWLCHTVGSTLPMIWQS